MKLVIGFDQRPGSERRRCALDHFVGCDLINIPFLAVAPVLGGDLESLEAGFLARLESLELLIFVDL
jgi:hypothetical protein